jgi:CubicO group peptidase (beta-lactamase class C family)
VSLWSDEAVFGVKRSRTPQVHGSCDPRFLALREAFAGNFRERGELGAALSVYIEGRPVVDIWAGWADQACVRPWERDTLVDVFSVGKGMVALSLLLLVERGQVDLDAPVARYWPGFASGGKGAITVRTLLGHRAGLPAIRRSLPELAIYDWQLMTSALADQEPWWKPGETHGYHVNTFGFLVGEIVRRVSGQTIGNFLRSEISDPLDADFHFGIGAPEEPRIAEFVWSTDRPRPRISDVDPELTEDDAEHALLLRCTYLNPPGLSGLGTVNTSAWRSVEIPSANGHANARATARIYGALACGGAVDGVRLLAPGLIEEATGEVSCGVDFVLRRPTRFGLGFQLTQPERPLGPNPRSFGHYGAGGSLGFADPDARLSFGYTPNRAGPRWQDPRNRVLIDATYACL